MIGFQESRLRAVRTLSCCGRRPFNNPLGIFASVGQIARAPIGSRPMVVDATVPTQSIVDQGVLRPLFRATEVVGSIRALRYNELIPIGERIQSGFSELIL